MGTEQLEQFEQLARRAVACKKWRWMSGMVVQGLATEWDFPHRPYRFDPLVHRPKGTSWPDLSDPATMGCLLALVREAHNAPDAYLMGSVTKQWVVHHFAEPEAYWKPLSKWQPTEAAALVAALEAAP